MTEQENTEQTQKVSTKQKVAIVVSVLLILSMVAFVVQNLDKVKIEFLMWEFRFRIVFLMLFSFGVGIFCTLAFKRYMKHRRKR